MLETRKKQIGRHTYKVVQLGSRKGRRVLVKLFKLAGPALGEGIAGGGVDSLTVSSAIRELANSADEDAFDSLCDTFAESTRIVFADGKEPLLSEKGIFDLHFAGHYSEMFQWLAFALEVNYGDFFGDSLKLAVQASGEKVSASPSQPE